MKQHMRWSAVATAPLVGVAVGHGLGATSVGAQPGLKGDTVPGVGCTAVASRHDEIANPSLIALDPINHTALNCAFNSWLIGGGGTL
ncbi:hypothetical protein [Nocardia sp. NPDC057272]|uniref:hypothetical protein n=1 Tax=Nocardia sp. NPDC057272 TaxID=3346079 RepID=UPI00362D907C